MADRIVVGRSVWEGDALSHTWATTLDGVSVELWYDGVWRWKIGNECGVLRCEAPPRGTVMAMETLITRWASQEL